MQDTTEILHGFFVNEGAKKLGEAVDVGLSYPLLKYSLKYEMPESAVSVRRGRN